MIAAAPVSGAPAAQDPPPAAESRDPVQRRDLDALVGIRLEYPRDKERVVARVDGEDVTLERVARHIEERHQVGFRAFLATPAGNLWFRHRQPTDWVRLYADVAALEAEARFRKVDMAAAQEVLETELKAGFEAWLRGYVEAQGDGAPPLTQPRVQALLENYQRDYGLAIERQGWLTVLTPGDEELDPDALHAFYLDYPRYFGGLVNAAHILIYHRHPVTGQLLDDAGRAGAKALLEEVRARLRPDGTNFEEVAELLSEDRRTGERGGVLYNIARFDDRLPPEVCRAAWSLRDGEVTGPIESTYGLHYVKRLSSVQQSFFLFTPAAHPLVRRTMKQKIQEDTMLEVRARRRVTLLY